MELFAHYFSPYSKDTSKENLVNILKIEFVYKIVTQTKLNAPLNVPKNVLFFYLTVRKSWKQFSIREKDYFLLKALLRYCFRAPVLSL